jgi:hypothetical protein
MKISNKKQKSTSIKFRGGAEVKAGELKPDGATTKLIALAQQEPDLFHDAMDDAYATIGINGHHETMLVKSHAFRVFLGWKFFRSEGRAAQPQAVTAALHTLEAMALYDKPEKKVHSRIAHEDGAIYLNLADCKRRIVRITSQEWSIVPSAQASVKFCIHKGMKPLPEPVRNGTLDRLRALVNVSDTDWPLYIGFALGCFRERGPFPILALLGGWDAGKTTGASVVKKLIDPSDPTGAGARSVTAPDIGGSLAPHASSGPA